MEIRKMVCDLSEVRDVIDEAHDLVVELEDDLSNLQDVLDDGRLHCEYLEGLLKDNDIFFSKVYSRKGNKVNDLMTYGGVLMKKIKAVVLIALLVLILVGCDNNKKTDITIETRYFIDTSDTVSVSVFNGYRVTSLDKAIDDNGTITVTLKFDKLNE